jgi:hypothetical protein
MLSIAKSSGMNKEEGKSLTWHNFLRQCKNEDRRLHLIWYCFKLVFIIEIFIHIFSSCLSNRYVVAMIMLAWCYIKK